jgi:hypothetical protein
MASLAYGARMEMQAILIAVAILAIWFAAAFFVAVGFGKVVRLRDGHRRTKAPARGD